MDDLLRAIAKNAAALLADAELLFEQSRFARAAALAVIASEEAGKFWSVKWDANWKQTFRSHPYKLAVRAPFHEAEERGVFFTSTGGTADTGSMADTYRAFPDHPEYEEWRQRAKSFDQIKQAGLYVNETGSSQPHTAIDKDKAAKCIACARRDVERLKVANVVRKSLPPLT
jgi:AbiV family abortive infection protein